MPEMTAEGMVDIRHGKKIRRDRLENFKKLILNEPENEDAIFKVLKEYNDDFEPFIHARYMIQAFNAGCSMWTWIPSLAAKYLIAPEFIGSLITYYLCSTLVAHALEQMTATDFSDQLEEMQTIYDCLLRKTSQKYDLSQPQIQRMIRLIGPLCTPEFLRVWPKVTGDNNDSSPGFFSRIMNWRNQPTETEALRNLKRDAELGLLAKNTFDGFVEASRFFLTDPRFRNLVQEKLPPGIRSIPPMIGAVVEHYKPHQP